MNKTEMLNYLASKTDDWRELINVCACVPVFYDKNSGMYEIDGVIIEKDDFESHVGIKTTHYTDNIGKEFRRREYANGKVWWQVRQSRRDDWMMVSGDPSAYIELEEV